MRKIRIREASVVLGSVIRVTKAMSIDLVANLVQTNGRIAQVPSCRVEQSHFGRDEASRVGVDAGRSPALTGSSFHG